MTWTDRTVLVTGAAGFVGSHLTERLVAIGARTRAFVHYNAARSAGWLDESPVRNEVEISYGDIRDCDGVRRAMQGVDIVFHLAALISIPYSHQAPVSYVRTNVEGTANVLKEALNAGAHLVVHTSTSEVYGSARYVPMDEDHPLRAQSPYSASKIAAEKLAEAFHLSFGLPVTVLRPFNTFGPRQSGRAVIPTIVAQAVTGSTVRLGNQKPTRDFNYVVDVVEGFIRAAECPAAVGQVIHLGTGSEITIQDLADKIFRLIGKDAHVVVEDERRRPDGSEVERLCADNRKAAELLGWSPRHTLEQGLVTTIDWIRGHLDRYRMEAYVI